MKILLDFTCIFLMIALVQSRIGISQKAIEALKKDVPPQIDIPKSLIGEEVSKQTDLPGKPLDPNDFMRAESIKIVNVPPIGGVDPILKAGKFQGDIVLPDRKIVAQLNSHVASDQSQELHNAVNVDEQKWPNAVIPYVIAESYNKNERAIIAKAIAAFHQNTCIRFVPRTSDPDYIFIRNGSGCSSPVGRTGGEQHVSLGDGCIHYGIVVHELMHTTGFWHEQSRADRDEHVTIIWKNILPGTEYNFQKYDWKIIQNLGAPYDTGSIMHYGPNSFAIDRSKPTIVANNGANIGQRNGFSEIDLTKLKTLYQCGGTDSSTPAPIITTPVPVEGCVDSNEYCSYWSSLGECEKNPSWMKNNCQKSCNQCGKCEDDNENCIDWTASGQCENLPEYMHKHCKKSCGICQTSGTVDKCVDENKFCSPWAESGECRVNPSYMLISCGKSCGVC